jgi:hypothetical protein
MGVKSLTGRRLYGGAEIQATIDPSTAGRAWKARSLLRR